MVRRIAVTAVMAILLVFAVEATAAAYPSSYNVDGYWTAGNGSQCHWWVWNIIQPSSTFLGLRNKGTSRVTVSCDEVFREIGINHNGLVMNGVGSFITSDGNAAKYCKNAAYCDAIVVYDGM